MEYYAKGDTLLAEFFSEVIDLAESDIDNHFNFEDEYPKPDDLVFIVFFWVKIQLYVEIWVSVIEHMIVFRNGFVKRKFWINFNDKYTFLLFVHAMQNFTFG